MNELQSFVNQINAIQLTKNSRDALALVGFLIGTVGYTFAIFMITRNVE